MIATPPCLYCSKALGPHTCRGPDSPAVTTARTSTSHNHAGGRVDLDALIRHLYRDHDHDGLESHDLSYVLTEHEAMHAQEDR